eukprot:c26946_g1_i4 orf=191-1288(+)
MASLEASLVGTHRAEEESNNVPARKLWCNGETIEIQKRFLDVLSLRHTEKVPLKVIPAEPPLKPLYQLEHTPIKCQIMASCPKGEIVKAKDQFESENLILETEKGDQGHLPVLIVKHKHEEIDKWRSKRKPAVVFLHSSYKNKEWLRPLLEAYAARGYVSVAVDSRYHGQRANSQTCYRNALVSAWRTGQTMSMPFIYDTVWDLIRLMDYLSERKDIDPTRIGITGESLGGMHTWFTAAIDHRYAVAVPIIGIQSFGWAVINEKWHARVASIHDVFEVAAKDMDKSSIDSEVVAKVWEKIAPGLSNVFDAVHTVPAIAPRPLLILNGKKEKNAAFWNPLPLFRLNIESAAFGSIIMQVKKILDAQ